MSFDLKKFQNTTFIPREKAVPVPALKDFFEGDATPEWKVRRLTGAEVGVVWETTRRNKKLTDIIEGLISNKGVKNVEAIKKLVGTSGDVPEEIARRLEMLVQGSVDPEIDMTISVKMCAEAWPSFRLLTDTIDSLTALGSEAKKKP